MKKILIIGIASIVFSESILADKIQFDGNVPVHGKTDKEREEEKAFWSIAGVVAAAGIGIAITAWFNPTTVLIYANEAREIATGIRVAENFSLNLERLINGEKVEQRILLSGRSVFSQVTKGSIVEENWTMSTLRELQKIRIKREIPFSMELTNEAKLAAGWKPDVYTKMTETVVSEYDKMVIVTYDMGGRRYVKPVWVPEKMVSEVHLNQYIKIADAEKANKVIRTQIITSTSDAERLLKDAESAKALPTGVKYGTNSFREDGVFSFTGDQLEELKRPRFYFVDEEGVEHIAVGKATKNTIVYDRQHPKMRGTTVQTGQNLTPPSFEGWDASTYDVFQEVNPENEIVIRPVTDETGNIDHIEFFNNSTPAPSPVITAPVRANWQDGVEFADQHATNQAKTVIDYLNESLAREWGLPVTTRYDRYGAEETFYYLNYNSGDKGQFVFYSINKQGIKKSPNFQVVKVPRGETLNRDKIIQRITEQIDHKFFADDGTYTLRMHISNVTNCDIENLQNRNGIWTWTKKSSIW